MQVCKPLMCAIILMLAASATAQLNLGSDGSDGAFVFVPDAGNANQMTIDLSLAPTVSYTTPSPMPGRGVYDQQQWAVVFKYTSINVPAGKTIRFTNHPAHPPVIWLAQSNAEIFGTINLDGTVGANWNVSTGSADSGPGGFEGGRSGGVNNIGNGAGLGPGGGPLPTVFDQYGHGYGTGGSFGTPGTAATSGNPLGITYGLVTLVPLMGGSGGSGARVTFGNMYVGGAGGGGGGAILIGANDTLRLHSGSRLSASGGSGGLGSWCFTPCRPTGGGGSGGAIRLIANTVNIETGVTVVAEGGSGLATTAGNGGLGRTRVEGNTLVILSDAHPPYSSAPPGSLFPTASTPVLRVTSINSQTPNLPQFPGGGFFYPYLDATISQSSPSTVRIEANNVPVTPTPAVVSLRLTLRNGASMSVMATLLGGNNAASSWSAEATFPVGLSSVMAVADLP